MDLVATLPWWAGVVLALASYLLLHSIAIRPVVVSSQPGQMGSMLSQTLWSGLATGGQYFLPFIFLSGAGLSAWRRRQRKRLVVDATQSEAGDALHGVSWREFEMLVGEGFRVQGYQVIENGGGGADGGVDLVLTRPGKNGGETFLVQCKQWRAFKVGVDVVRGLYGVMAARGAAGGFVVTSGRFTDDAVDFARGRNLTLIDGPKLHSLLTQAKAGIDRSPTRATSVQSLQPRATDVPRQTSAPASSRYARTQTRTHTNTPTETPACPLCAKPMTMRTATRGANAGRAFWGCTGYPACRATRSIG